MHYKEREPPQDSPSAAPHHPSQLREELIWPGGNCLPLQPPRSLTPHHTTPPMSTTIYSKLKDIDLVIGVISTDLFREYKHYWGSDIEKNV